MQNEQVKLNQASWLRMLERCEESKLRTLGWKDYRCEIEILKYGIEQGFDRYFLASTSADTLVFATIGYPERNFSPRIHIDVAPDDQITLCYIHAITRRFKDHGLEYKLNLADALPTFRRFLNHVWTLTQNEPMPYELRRPGFYAPVLSNGEKFKVLPTFRD